MVGKFESNEAEAAFNEAFAAGMEKEAAAKEAALKKARKEARAEKKAGYRFKTIAGEKGIPGFRWSGREEKEGGW